MVGVARRKRALAGSLTSAVGGVSLLRSETTVEVRGTGQDFPPHEDISALGSEARCASALAPGTVPDAGGAESAPSWGSAGAAGT